MTPDRAGKTSGPRPAFVVAGLTALVILAAVLTPEPTQSSGNGGLTTYSSALDGAQLFFDLARHLGWRVARRETPIMLVTPANEIQALLAPNELVTGAETHVLLESVRAGGALLVVGEVPALEDSLHLGMGDNAGTIQTSPPDTTCRRLTAEMAVSGQFTPFVEAPQVVWTAPPPSSPVVLASLGQSPLLPGEDISAGDMVRMAFGRSVDTARRGTDSLQERRADSLDAARLRNARAVRQRRVPPRPAAIGFALGAGRIVFVAGSDVLANNSVRACRTDADLLAVRALDYLSSGSPSRDIIVFDEYHHGYGEHPSTWRAVRTFIASTSVGQMLSQVVVAGVLLLFAAGPRPVPPRDPVRTARRSPLEQADALASAYAGVHGTRTVAARLVGGLRRRLGMVRAGRTADDDAFLVQLASVHPALQPEIALVRRALQQPMDDKELPTLAAAMQRIETALSGSIIPSTRTT